MEIISINRFLIITGIKLLLVLLFTILINRLLFKKFYKFFSK